MKPLYFAMPDMIPERMRGCKHAMNCGNSTGFAANVVREIMPHYMSLLLGGTKSILIGTSELRLTMLIGSVCTVHVLLNVMTVSFPLWNKVIYLLTFLPFLFLWHFNNQYMQ